MATDAKMGFRLPWSGEQREDGEPLPDETAEPAAASAGRPPEELGDDPVGGPAPDGDGDLIEHRSAGGAASASASGPARHQTLFLAELRRAMQQTAAAAREDALARLQSETKAVVEEIHARSAAGAKELRNRADEEIAAIRDWSKAEIARIREETETRITVRKSTLAQEIEDHAALIEREIERIHSRVSTFEAEMAAFFERLFAENDPARFATMAQTLPEPPVLEISAALEPTPPTAADDPAGPRSQGADDDEPGVRAEAHGLTPDDAAAAEAAALAALLEADDDPTDAPVQEHGRDDEHAATSGAVSEGGSREPADAHGDRAVDGTAETAPAEPATSRVVVAGLASVAGIAGFKRELGRKPGVDSVVVSSGLDGDFVFTVTHAAGADLVALLKGLADFRTEVTSADDGEIRVSAEQVEAG